MFINKAIINHYRKALKSSKVKVCHPNVLTAQSSLNEIKPIKQLEATANLDDRNHNN